MNCNQTREAIDSSLRRAAYGDSVNAHLSGCPDCRRNADETESLLMLLKAQPRVEAPADFDFRLRARIARAEAEQAHSIGFLEKIWESFLAQTFSWGQAATAMAAVAVLIMVSTYYVRHESSAPVTANNTEVAIASADNKASAQSQPMMESQPDAKAVAPARLAPARVSNKGYRTAAYRPAATVETASFKDIASVDNMPRFYSRETRQVVQDRNAFGAELISANTVKTAALAPSF